MRTWVPLCVVVCALMAVALADPEPPVAYGAPSSGYSSGGYSGGDGGYSSGGGDHGHGHTVVASQGWGWKPKVRYLNLKIPIPQLPKIRLGLKAGIKASISHAGWGWRK